MTDFTGLNYKNLVMNFSKVFIEEKKDWFPNGINCVDKETFLKDNKKVNESIFNKLDFDGDGYISEQEFNMVKYLDENKNGKISKKENSYNRTRAMNQALFSARRNVDKWFTTDINRDGHWSNVEIHMARYRMGGDDPTKEHQLDASMTNDELAELYDMVESTEIEYGTLEDWNEDWSGYIKNHIKDLYGYDLSEADMILVKKEMIKQLNTWLFKTGDNATHNAPLYQSLNSDSYTRLMTHDSAESCCGGNIIPPPATDAKTSCMRLFSEIEYTDAINDAIQPHNTAEEVKNRLAWAIYQEPQQARDIQEQINREKMAVEEKVKSGEMTREEADKLDWPIWERMSDEDYAQAHNQYARIRNMSAADFRELLKPENEEARKTFEKTSNMRVFQIVQYIDIVESVTGEDFDSPDWAIGTKQFLDICARVNDTHEDAGLLEGKTRADIPENRQALLRFLEEKGWLFEQFK